MYEKQGTLTKCRTCGEKVSSTAPTCPHCGEPDPSQATGPVEGSADSAVAEHVNGQNLGVVPPKKMGLKTKKILPLLELL